MKNIPSLKKNWEFQQVYKKKNSYANRYLIMYIIENNLSYTRIGISASKKVGNSVIRHRAVRLIREAYRLNRNHCLPGYDMVVVTRPAAKDQGYKVIESALLHLMKLHRIYVASCSEELK